MFEIKNINIVFNEDVTLFYISLIFLIFYAIYVYRYTIPKLSAAKKTALVILRTLSLLILLLAIFQPSIKYSYPEEKKKDHFIFVDNSSSMKFADSLEISSILNKINKQFSNPKLYTFSSSIIPFTDKGYHPAEKFTNFESILDFIKPTIEDLSGITIISDGNQNSGRISNTRIEELNIPIYTLGIGDTIKHNDVELKKIIFNSFMYKNVASPIDLIIQTNSIGKNINVSISDQFGFSQNRIISLKESLTKVSFSYKPTSTGKTRVNFSLSNLENEINIANNNKSISLNVLNDKIKVGLITGSLSNDYRFVKNALREDENKEILDFIKITPSSSYSRINKISECDALFLIGFPSSINTSDEIAFLNNQITQNKIPYFLSLSNGTDFEKLKLLSDILSFQLTGNLNDERMNAIPEIVDFNSPLIKNNSLNPYKIWEELPPVVQSKTLMMLLPGTNIISTAKESNAPLIVSNNQMGIKSVNVLAADFWKWKLNSFENIDVFERFINSSVKWLVADESMNTIIIKPTKDQFSAGEPIEFTAKVYDETFSPINDANIEIAFSSEQTIPNLRLILDKDGEYSGQTELNKTGTFNYTAAITRNKEIITKKNGEFSIADSDLELQVINLNKEFLTNLSTISGGNYFNSDEIDDLIEKIKVLEKKNTYVINRHQSSVFDLKPLILSIIISLLTLEWILRKQWRLL